MLERLLSRGMLTSVTAASLTGAFGRTIKAFAGDLMARGEVHNVASDGHAAQGHRAPLIAPLMIEAGYRAQMERVSRAVPHAVITGAAIPPAEPSGSRGRLRRLGRRGR